MLEKKDSDEKPMPSGRGRPAGTGGRKSDAVITVRKRLGITQQQLAQEINCSLSAVRYMEREGRLPGTLALLEAFKKIAKRAGVNLTDEAQCDLKSKEQIQ